MQVNMEQISFLKKNNDWQNQLCKIMSEYIDAGKEDEDW